MSRPSQIRRQTTRQAAAGRQAMLAAMCAVAIAAIAVGLWREAANPRFAVDLVAVRGLEHTPSADVVAAAALTPGQNAWLIDRLAVKRRVEALPWVGNVSLQVSWPNRLTVDVTERRPAALVALASADGAQGRGARYAAIDDTQRVLAVGVGAGRETDLPKLIVVPPPADATPGSGLDRAEIGQALDAYRRLSSLGLRISEVAIAPSTGISATADRNLRVLFGEDEDLAKKAQLFQAIVAKISTPSHVAYVDVRSIRAPTVLYR